MENKSTNFYAISFNEETRSLAEEVNNSLMELITSEDDLQERDPTAEASSIFESHLEGWLI